MTPSKAGNYMTPTATSAKKVRSGVKERTPLSSSRRASSIHTPSGGKKSQCKVSKVSDSKKGPETGAALVQEEERDESSVKKEAATPSAVATAEDEMADTMKENGVPGLTELWSLHKEVEGLNLKAKDPEESYRSVKRTQQHIFLKQATAMAAIKRRYKSLGMVVPEGQAVQVEEAGHSEAEIPGLREAMIRATASASPGMRSPQVLPRGVSEFETESMIICNNPFGMDGWAISPQKAREMASPVPRGKMESPGGFLLAKELLLPGVGANMGSPIMGGLHKMAPPVSPLFSVLSSPRGLPGSPFAAAVPGSPSMARLLEEAASTDCFSPLRQSEVA